VLTKLFKLFNKNTEVHRPIKVVQQKKTSTAVEKQLGDSHSTDWTEVEQSFTGMLLGVNSLLDGPMSKQEKLAIEAINKKYLQNSSVEYQIPRLPEVIPKVLQALRDKNIDPSNLANMLCEDMVLVKEVIRLANSVHYDRTRAYKSLEQATINIGFNGIRQLIISAALKPILTKQSGRFSNITNRYLWDKSMKTGLLSDSVAHTLGENRFFAYLAGLVVQSGMSVISKEFDKCFINNEVPNNRLFIDAVSRYTYKVSAGISQQWQFPEEVSCALEEQVIYDDPDEMTAIGKITYLSDKMVKINSLKANGQLGTASGDVSKLIKGDMRDAYIECQKKIGINTWYL
jgi:HD-like signal output (HDOD) protein